MPKDKLMDKDKLLKIFNYLNKHISLDLIGERQMKFIQYLGKDLGYDWK